MDNYHERLKSGEDAFSALWNAFKDGFTADPTNDTYSGGAKLGAGQGAFAGAGVAVGGGWSSQMDKDCECE